MKRIGRLSITRYDNSEWGFGRTFYAIWLALGHIEVAWDRNRTHDEVHNA